MGSGAIEPGLATYNVPMVARALGALNVKALRESLNEIVRRHESLRTNFLRMGERPIPVIADKLMLNVAVIDFTLLSEKQVKAKLEELLGRERERAFDLAREPLIRCCVVKLSESEHVIAMTLHHMVCDGWSAELILKELSVIFPAYASEKPSLLPAPALQYSDFAAWQRQCFEAEGLKAEISHWKNRLADAPHVLNLPNDHPRPGVIIRQIRNMRSICQVGFSSG